MKVSKNQMSVSSFAVVKNAVLKAGLRLPLIVLALALFLVPSSAMASREKYVINFDDSHIRGHKGEAATIYLKRSLKEQYPSIDLKNAKIRKVVLVAKSKKGRGGAQLRVGDRMTDMYEVGGSPRSFRDDHPSSFDRIAFRNPAGSSRGPWQIDLKGNFIVRKVVVVVEDNRWRRYHRRWSYNW